MEEKEQTQGAESMLGSGWRSFLSGARVSAVLLFFPLLALFLNLIRPGTAIRTVLMMHGQPVLAAVIIASLFAAGDSFRAIIKGYKRLSGVPWRPSLVFAAAALNIVMACHWLLSPPAIP
jgi:hypothetical protein